MNKQLKVTIQNTIPIILRSLNLTVSVSPSLIPAASLSLSYAVFSILIMKNPQNCDAHWTTSPKARAQPKEVASEIGGSTKLLNTPPSLATAILNPKAKASSLPTNHLAVTTD